MGRSIGKNQFSTHAYFQLCYTSAEGQLASWLKYVHGVDGTALRSIRAPFSSPSLCPPSSECYLPKLTWLYTVDYLQRYVKQDRPVSHYIVSLSSSDIISRNYARLQWVQQLKREREEDWRWADMYQRLVHKYSSRCSRYLEYLRSSGKKFSCELDKDWRVILRKLEIIGLWRVMYMPRKILLVSMQWMKKVLSILRFAMPWKLF